MPKRAKETKRRTKVIRKVKRTRIKKAKKTRCAIYDDHF